MNKVNEFIFNRQFYKDDAEFNQKINEQITLLLSTDYVCVISSLEPGLVSIKYCKKKGDPLPYFLWADEADYVELYHKAVAYYEAAQKMTELKQFASFVQVNPRNVNSKNNKNAPDDTNDDDDSIDDILINDDEKGGKFEA